MGMARSTWKVGLQSPDMETPSDRKPGAQTGGPGLAVRPCSEHLGSAESRALCPGVQGRTAPGEGCQAAIRSGRGPKERAP